MTVTNTLTVPFIMRFFTLELYNLFCPYIYNAIIFDGWLKIFKVKLADNPAVMSYTPSVLHQQNSTVYVLKIHHQIRN